MKRNYVRPSIAVIDMATVQIIAASINERPGSWGNINNNEDAISTNAGQQIGEWGNLWNK